MGASPPSPGDRFWRQGQPFAWLAEGPLGDRFWHQGEPALSITLTGNFVLAHGIVSGEAFGYPQLQLLLQILGPAGVASGEIFGAVGVIPDQFLYPAGILTVEAVGAAGVFLRQTAAAQGIVSREAFGRAAVGRREQLSWDLRLETGLRGAARRLVEEIQQRLGQFRLKPSEIQTIPLPLPGPPPAEEAAEDKVARLAESAALLEKHVDWFLGYLRQVQGPAFPVPRDDTALQAALLALQVDQEVVRFDDYLDLLQLQIDLAAHGSQAGLNETLIYAGGQIELVISFYEKQLQSTISEAAAWAMQAKPLIKTKYTASVIQDRLNSYRDFPVNNTVLEAMGGRVSLGDILRECIPCLERTLSLDGIRPLEQLLSLLQSEIDRRWNYIQGLWKIVNSREANICDLLNYLNSLCIPDLFALLAVLSYYWLQLTQLFQVNVWNLLWSLIQPLLQGILGNLASLLDQFIRLLLAPVECIITSIDREYAKLYNLAHASWDPKKGLTVNKPYDHTFEKWAHEQIVNPILYGRGEYGMGLLELKRALVNARDFVNSQFKRLADAIKEALGADADALATANGLFLLLRWLALIVGLVKAIIRFKQDGYRCGPEGPDRTQQRVLADYLSDITGVPFLVEAGAPSEPPLVEVPSDQADSRNEVLRELLGIGQGLAPLSGRVLERPPAEFGPAYTLPDCVARRSELDAAKAAAWAAELDALVS